MALPPLLFETIVSPIEQAGDYFIMDSDQLISNPYKDMQKNVVDDSQRRASLSERLTSVRNSICSNHFHLAKERLDREENSSLRNLHETSSTLRYNVKLLDLDRRKNTVEINKRLQPDKDYSYDEHQLQTSEKRLGIAGPCYYLRKSLKHPVRHSGLQEKVTPALAEARKAFHRYKYELVYSRPDRMSLSGESKSRRSLASQSSRRLRSSESFRPSSKSAKSYSGTASKGSVQKWAFLTQPLEERSEGLPKFSVGRVRANTLPNITQSSDSQTTRPSGHKVKFAFPANKSQSFERLDAHILERSKTFHEGVTNKEIKNCYMLDSDDEEPPPRKVDLQELFHGKALTRPSTQASSIAHRKRSTYNAPGHMTQEMNERESAMIQRKVNTFLNNVESWDPTLRMDSDSSSDEEEEPRRFSPIVPKAHVNPFSRHFLSVMAEEEAQAKKLEQEWISRNNPPQKVIINENKSNQDKKNTEESGKGDNTESRHESKRAKIVAKWKDTAWRVSRPDNALRKMSADDLILQKLMGINVTNGSKKITGVPVNSAGRALRHTPTFKMRKVVEDLKSGRTKYQEFEVENIKKKLESGMDISQLEEDDSQNQTELKARFEAVTMDDSISDITEEGESDIKVDELPTDEQKGEQYFTGNLT